MSIDTAYRPVEYIYKSRGLAARPIEDQAPEYVYLQLMNWLEREEFAMSSRFGTQIINRDATGSGTSNHYFASPITSLSRLNYQSSAWRYAGLADGTLWRRAGNGQGAYTQIDSGLSGDPFTSLVTNCFETSQPFNFIADAATSLKDNGSFSAPQLWGIDPPPYTANAIPYSPLLTLIDNFASGNTYASSGFSVGWAYASVTSIPALSSQSISDFTEFFGVNVSGDTLAGSSVTATQTGPGTNSNSVTYSGFPSTPISGGAPVTITIPYSGSYTDNAGSFTSDYDQAAVTWYYSIDSGTTFTAFLGNIITPRAASGSFPSGTYTLVLSGLINLDTVQIRATAKATSAEAGVTITSTAVTGTISASVNASGVFGDVCNGIISNLNTNSSINVPIVSVVSSGFADNAYLLLTVTTSTAHGLTGSPMISIYGSSNDLVDGFYQATVTGTTTFTVPFYSVSAIGATGGFVFGGAAAPASCVLVNEYASPYPTQFSAWGLYQKVPLTTTSFPIGCWSGTVAANTNALVTAVTALDLNLNNQATDDDLIVITIQVGTPANVENIRLYFDVNSSAFTSSYYYKDISPAYYQGGVDQSDTAYAVTQSQILADTLNLITGQPPGTTAAQVQPGNFSTGEDAWIAVYLRRGDFVAVGQAGQSGLDWTNITGWRLEFTTNTTGSSTVGVNGIYFQWGYGPSSFGGVGYDYRYSYYDANTGTESNPCPQMFFGGTQFGYLSSQAAPIYLRQAVRVTGTYSTDTQVTHVRIYRRGGTLNSNWVQIDQIPNNSAPGSFINFTYKDVIPDAYILQAPPLVLDNDPPVTSSLSSPIQTTLVLPTTGPGNTYYSTFSPQLITVVDNTAVFVPNQLVDIGYAANLEVTQVIVGGTGSFTAVVRLQHNAGEPVNAYAIPRQPCNLCAFAYNQVWLAGDPNNPHYLYYSKKGLPENFGPQNYIPVSTPDDPINAVIDWRGTLIVGTLKTWKIIVGGASPYAQPTGSVHGIVAQGGWAEVEGAIWYRAADGLREFTGADGLYKTLPIEWIYINNPQCLPPQANKAQASQDVMAYFNNQVIASYISLNSGLRYRNVYDTNYQRFRQDDVPATAMLWEKDINTLVVGKEISPGNYAVVQDQIGDYDDGGWVAGSLARTPINLTIQQPYRDLGKPHDPKNWNGLETDVNTQSQVLNTTLLFEDGAISLALDPINTGTTRQKAESIVNLGEGQQAYRASILHTMAVTVAPTLYQEAIDAALLPPNMSSWDTYNIKFGTDDSKFAKESYWDYTSTVPINVSLYADDSYPIPYFTFQLPAQSSRVVIRVRHSNVNAGTTAFSFRTWRAIALAVTATDPLQTFMFWNNPKVSWKPIGSSHSYQIKELEV
jgi:hypothetical protein